MSFKPPFIILLAGLCLPNLVYAENRALIMGIEKYSNKPLHGIPKDLEHAQQIAKAMDIPAENIVVKRDAQLTYEGLSQTLNEFAASVTPRDRVFIYFSGHGSSYSKSPGQCAKAIVTQEGKAFDREKLQNQIQPLIKRAAKTFVFLDTCFSGGVITDKNNDTRTYAKDQSVAKFYTDPNDPCSDVTNMLENPTKTRDFIVEAKKTPNYYLLGAAGPTEVAVDGGPVVGSLATSAFAECLNSTQADSNHDGIVTLHENFQCAQQQVDELLPAIYTAQTLTEGNGKGGNLPASFSDNTEPSQQTIESYRLVETLVHAADVKASVTIKPSQKRYRIGQDELEMDIQASSNGFLTLYSIGSSGKFYQLFPNELDTDNRIVANQPLHLPRDTWSAKSLGPAGINRLLAIVASDPNRFANLGISVSPFAKLDNTVENAKQLLLRSQTPSKACDSNELLRDFEVQAKCASTYSASFKDVQEIKATD